MAGLGRVMGITELNPASSPESNAVRRLQSTRLQNNVGQAIQRLDQWALNPWRKLSLLSLSGLIGFLIGSAITSVAGVLGQMDPVAALLVVLGAELTIRRRRSSEPSLKLLQQLLDLGRIGFLYGLFLEGFKLI
ncbi:putative membrane protein Ycf20 [Synechococcus sp. PROS-U-1]|nr:putative membrane protein Ycf20 [Synechococcus sp. PROS-U-1]